MSYSARIHPRPSIAAVLLEAGVVPPKPKTSPVPRLNLPSSPFKSSPSSASSGTPVTPGTPISPLTPLAGVTLNSPLRMSFGNPAFKVRSLHSTATVAASASAMHVATPSFTVPSIAAPSSPPRIKPTLHVTVPEEEAGTVLSHPFPPPHPVEPIRFMSVSARKERKLYTPPNIRQAYDACILTMTPIVPASPRGARTPSPYPSSIPSILQPSPVFPTLSSPVSDYSPGSAYSITPTSDICSALTDLPVSAVINSAISDLPLSAVINSAIPKPASTRSIQFADSPHPRYTNAPGGLKPDGPPSALGRGRPRRNLRPEPVRILPGMGISPNLLSPVPPPMQSDSPAASPLSPAPLFHSDSPVLRSCDSASSLPYLAPSGPSPVTLTVSMVGLSPLRRPAGLASPGMLSASYVPRIPSPLRITTAGLSPRLAPVALPSAVSLLRLSPSPMSPMSPMLRSPMLPVQIREALGPVAHVWGVIYWVCAYYGGWNPLSITNEQAAYM